MPFAPKEKTTSPNISQCSRAFRDGGVPFQGGFFHNMSTYKNPHTPSLEITNGFCRDNTPWKINMEHNHRGLEDHFPL